MLRGAARLLRVSAAGDAGAARSALESRGCAVVSVEQHREQDRLFERVTFDAGNGLDAGALEAALAPDAVTVRAADERPRLAVFAGKEPGCLEELLERSRRGELRADVAGVLSNHATLAPLAADYGVPFQCFGGDDMEAAQLAWLAELKTDLVALARYMQILGPAFCEAYAGRALNVHHSLLPAFPGARPYDAAWARGVKLVGATAHYATADLDEGPIIEQDCARISHKNSIDDLLRKGRVLRPAPNQDLVGVAATAWWGLDVTMPRRCSRKTSS